MKTLRTWLIRFTLHGHQTETIVEAQTQAFALQLAKTQYPEGTSFNAIEITDDD